MSFEEILDEAWLNWIITIGTLLGMVATYFRGVISQNKHIESIKEELFERLTDVEKKQITTDTRFNVFWTVVEKELPKVLLRLHTPEIDKYLRKIQNGEQLTPEERRNMKDMMRQVLDKTIDNPETDTGLKLGYALLLAKLESDEVHDERKQMEEEDRDRGVYKRHG